MACDPSPSLMLMTMSVRQEHEVYKETLHANPDSLAEIVCDCQRVSLEGTA